VVPLRTAGDNIHRRLRLLAASVVQGRHTEADIMQEIDSVLAEFHDAGDTH
jgi:hypothetical protein